jgi:hypothetical protein
MEEILGVLRRVDARRFREIERYVHQITVWVGSHTAFDRFGGIHLSCEFLCDAPSAFVAAALVHETTHLRIAKAGIEYRSAMRERIEVACTHAEAGFLRKVGGEKENERADELVRGLGHPWWTTAERRARVREGFESVGLPGWLSRIIR